MDVNQLLSQAAQAKEPSKQNEKSTDIFDDLMKSLTRGLGGFFKVTGMNFMSKIGEVGVLANVKLEDMGLKSGKMINEGAANFSGRGGVAAETIMGGLQFDSIKDFSKLVAAAVEPIQHLLADGLQGTHVSYGEIGQLYVQAGLPNLVQGQGLGMQV